MHDPSRVRVSGPLEVFASGFAAELARLGYRRTPATFQLQLTAHASRWLQREGLGAAELTAADVVAFVVDRCPVQSRGAAKMTVTALRSLLGFLHLRGIVSGPLGEAVPSTASWRLSGLPRALEPEQLQALLACCDRAT